jgi:hypothetical protein
MSYEPPAGILIGADVVEGTKEGERIASFIPSVFADIEELEKERTGAALVPMGIVRSTDPHNHTTFKQMLEVWIEPEMRKRIASGVSQESLSPLRQALIVFPPRTSPERYQVLLNEEVVVSATVRPAYHASFAHSKEDEEVQLRLGDIFDIRGAHLEGVAMDTDGFAWLRPEAGVWTMYFNFLPNSGFEDKLTAEEKSQFARSLGDAVAQEMLRAFTHGVLTDDHAVRSSMASDGWCPTPILLTNAWQAMCAAYAHGDPAAAEAIAIAAVGPEEIDKMVETWIVEEPFTSDRRFLETGTARYKEGDYISAISVLLPRIEGLANRVREKRGIGARDSISQVFNSLDQLASADVRDGYLAAKIRDEFNALITSFLLVHFKPSAPGADATRGRHAHAHGATGDPLYDQAYALKIILALDALFFVAR